MTRTYRGAGVDLDAADALVGRIGDIVTSTWDDNVVGGFGGFAGGFKIPPGFEQPVLMMTTDGVGTKLEIARRSGNYEGLGYDLVAMCVDDLAAAGATPLAFTDYLAVGSLDPQRDETLIGSIAAACSAAGCALVGGETAEHPGTMAPDAFDLAGAVIGVVEESQVVTGEGTIPGDVVIGVRSPNLRSNGFSLVRAVIEGMALDGPFPNDSRSLGEVLLEPSVIYAPAVLAAIAGGGVRGLAHITGGGIAANVSRALPDSVDARIDASTWEIPNVFLVIEDLGGIDRAEMLRVFNMGIGFVIVADPSAASAIIDELAGHEHAAAVIGDVVEGTGRADVVG